MKQSSATKHLQEQVLDAGLCTHCGACVNLCPYYASYDDRVVVLDQCSIVDGGCNDICPRQPTDLPALAGSQVYACGAPIMVESAQRDFVARCGLPADEFYADSFTSEADKHGPTA